MSDQVERGTQRDVDRVIDSTECIGVIGSPSSTSQLTLDILGAAATRKLVGELVFFRFMQDRTVHYALGQITGIQLRNQWHEYHSVRSLVRQHGRLDPISEFQDTHSGQIEVSAVFRRTSNHTYEPSILGTVPSTGTFVHVATEELLRELLRPHEKQIFYLGYVYGSKPKLPLWFKHFGHGEGGAGEAYHLGIFGKTGSGKSVLAKMILLAYARFPQMAILVIDPQGEFSKDLRGTPTGEFRLRPDRVLKNLGRDFRCLTVQNLVLDRWKLFEEVLFESLFFQKLTIPKGENRRLACEILSEQLQKKGVQLSALHEMASFHKAWEILQDEGIQAQFYRSQESRERFRNALKMADRRDLYNCWKPVAELFATDRSRRDKSLYPEEESSSKEKPSDMTVDGVLKWLLKFRDEEGRPRTKRPILVVDLSREQAEGFLWNERIQTIVIRRLLEGILRISEDCYRENQSLNTLILIDEAHRFASRETPEDEVARDVRNLLIDAVRTTRKYGLGWLFISQTLSSLHREIIEQIRIFFFGFGLGLGQEFQALREIVGPLAPALNLYQLFRDPHSAPDLQHRQYSFMTVGPVSPLSFAGTPLFFNTFNSVEEFLRANNLSDENSPNGTTPPLLGLDAVEGVPVKSIFMR
ncbi:MAG: DUF87 domain-containing protein [Nitrososphaerota archaeon]